MLFQCIKGSDNFFNLYDKTNKTTQSYNRIVDDLFSDGLELPFQSENFIFFENNNTLMFIIQPSWLIENKDKIVSSKLNSIMQGLNEEDNPILMVGRLK